MQVFDFKDYMDNVSDSIEIVKQQNLKKGLVLLGSVQYVKGLTLFQVNLITKEVAPAEYSESYWNPIEKKGTRKLIVVKNCIYRQFLNKKSATRWVDKNL